MKQNLLILALALLLIVLLFFPKQIYWLFYPHSKQDVIEQVFKNREIYYAICYPQDVTAQRLQSNGNDTGKLDGYAKDAAVTLPPEDVQQLRSLLQKSSSYRWRHSLSTPDYDAVLNFRAQGHVVRIALSFKNNVFGVFDGEDDKDEQINTECRFDPIRDQLVAICKTVFPDDRKIQALQ
jgi:hypothetical protein